VRSGSMAKPRSHFGPPVVERAEAVMDCVRSKAESEWSSRRERCG
jgi:hypothetical protein